MTRSTDYPPLSLAARDIPVPAHISPEAQAFLAAAAARPRAPVPADANADWWRAAAREWNARMLPMVEPFFMPDLVSIETRQINGATIYDISPRGIAVSPDHALLEIHGGAMVFGEGRFCMILGALRALTLSSRVLAVDYRMPPDHPYPTPLDDCLSGYRFLLEMLQPANIAVGGMSAGGNLAAALVLRARDEGLPVPGALLLLTPECDLTESGDSFITNAEIDVALPQKLPEANALYAHGNDLAHPYLSPLFGDLTGAWPKTYLQTGTRDLFLSNTVRMHRALLNAGQTAELHVWEAMPHAGFGGAAPEDRELFASIRSFLAKQAGWPIG